MLVLSRKKNESIVINDSITVTVIEIRGDKVKLGIEAPKTVSVHRREVFDAIQAQRAAEAPVHADEANAHPGDEPVDSDLGAPAPQDAGPRPSTPESGRNGGY